MKWLIGDAKQGFSKMIQHAQKEPQMIYKRDRLVAAVVDAQTYEELITLKKERSRVSLADAFVPIRALCQSQNYRLEAPIRANRPVAEFGES